MQNRKKEILLVCVIECGLCVRQKRCYALYMSGLVLWITGLPGSGKSTIADAIKQAHPDFTLLRMDDMRKIITPQPTYSEVERDIVYRSIVSLAKVLAELGHDVLIDATGNLRRWRDLAREIIPHYVEVYLKCPIETCQKREAIRKDTRSAPKNIYKKGGEGWPVPGITALYEVPLNPEIVIETDNTSVEDAVAIIRRAIA
jgi:adenylylsulfate kinase